MSNPASSHFPSTQWCWDISRSEQETVKILHPSGLAFVSPVVLNRFDRLEEHDKKLYNLTEKDSFLLSYTIDYFKNKSRVKGLSTQESIILSANLVCAYRFRSPLNEEGFTDLGSTRENFRKFGEHHIEKDSKRYEVFVIGHNKETLIAITMEDIDEKIKKLETLELPRSYFIRFEGA
ncbi:hypothetical protein HBN50_06745 [Halobacteriovorax sp. GB3]|uniref:hypothetical protein n=1 Tax=Halobacteriovorax sp. GB3 TaxID=2719615 RepID=UPI00235DD03B|nr:hypothetical protein [Halobacteriovorax sp. GB3]MDD0852785.1 hypothetical protein [Halobacteriovorax sp. GB3]